MIRELKENEINGLNVISPIDWKFDYEDFLRLYYREDYFKAFLIIQDDSIIGTGNVFLKDKIGWLANIIVDEKYRKKGFGFKMTKFLVDYLSNKGCETQLLIATELGEAVYQKNGFTKIADYQCYDSETAFDFKYSKSIRFLKSTDLEQVCELDFIANDEDRKHLIKKYYKSGLGYFNKQDVLVGFYLPEFGRGLVLSTTESAGLELLKIKHSKKGRRSLLPLENKIGIDFLDSIGLKKGMKSSRMILGKENLWKPAYIYSYGSGFCG